MEMTVATCGLTCTECPAYLATKAADQLALEELAKTWSVEYNAELTAADCTCEGCHSTTGPWMSHCAVCEIRSCGSERGVESCAECSDYACEKLTAFFEFVPEAKATLDALRGAIE